MLRVPRLLTAPGYNYWQGRIDELAIFNQALSEEQIKSLYYAMPEKTDP